MLTIHFANRLETLAEQLAASVGGATGAVFEEDQVVVPSAALRRHLTLLIARRHGVCAGVRFAYLARWLWQQIARVVPDVDDESPFDPALLAWRIYAAFGDEGWLRPHRRLAAYLEQSDPVMRFELAHTVAALFDQYITYRPDWLSAWTDGRAADLGAPPSAEASARDDEAWQAALWRRLTGELGATDRHPVARFSAALKAQGARLVASGALPSAVHVFALPAMPPLHLGLLQSLAEGIDVHVYALNPCREYWFDVVDRRRLAWLAARDRLDFQETGHRLLAGWGRQTQSQLSLLVEATGDAVHEDASFVENPAGNLLAQLQNSILDLVDLAPGSLALAADDHSIEAHVCHSPTREIEVLHDRLLALFAGPDAPALDEVLVVTPDLEAMAPLVDAVFGTAPKERYIPYSVTGRARSRVNAAARVLLDLLALVTSRCAANDVFGLLRQPLVARRFGLDADDLDRVRAWLQAAGVHWALDADHRGSLGLPAVARHSFADGLERLFLGYAMPSQAGQPFDDRLPAGDAEGSSALALGALWHFVDQLAALRRRAGVPQPGADWIALLAEALDRFAAPRGSELEDVQEVRAALDALGARIAGSGLAQPLPVDVVRAALQKALDDPARGGVPGGTVTVSSLSSLRNVPFKVVCAIGLNDGAFPSGTRPPEFDLMALQPRRGDRQRRLDERNLFLDLLLAARERVHLSYVGRSVRDNSIRPPSVLVAELLDVLIPAVADDPGDARSLAQARGRLVVEHPLQPFSEAAFRRDGDPRRRSFQHEYADALKRRPGHGAPGAALRSTGTGPAAGAVGAAVDDADDDAADEDGANEALAPFFAQPLPEPGLEWHELPLERLIKFFRNPCRFLLGQRLGIELPVAEEELQDDEPFVADVPSRTALARRLLPPLLQGADPAAVRALALAGTEVPVGAFGDRLLERELAALQPFATQVREATREPCLEPRTVTVDVALDGRTWRVHAGFADLRAGGLVRYRYDELRATDRISAWLHHLLLCAGAPAGVAPVTVWHARDTVLRFKPCADPGAVLQTLVQLYRRGLCEPLAFFPKTAWAYVDGNDRLSAALQAWQVSPHRPHAEGADAAYRLALRGRPDPLGDGLAEFRACAHAVYDPLRACIA